MVPRVQGSLKTSHTSQRCMPHHSSGYYPELQNQIAETARIIQYACIYIIYIYIYIMECTLTLWTVNIQAIIIATYHVYLLPYIFISATNHTRLFYSPCQKRLYMYRIYIYVYSSREYISICICLYRFIQRVYVSYIQANEGWICNFKHDLTWNRMCIYPKLLTISNAYI